MTIKTAHPNHATPAGRETLYTPTYETTLYSTRDMRQDYTLPDANLVFQNHANLSEELRPKD